jgi:hypothetical protein
MLNMDMKLKKRENWIFMVDGTHRLLWHDTRGKK